MDMKLILLIMHVLFLFVVLINKYLDGEQEGLLQEIGDLSQRLASCAIRLPSLYAARYIDRIKWITCSGHQ